MCLRLTLFLLAVCAYAQAPAGQPSPSASGVRDNRSTPRGALIGFLEAARRGEWRSAASYLHPGTRGDAHYQRLAQELKRVLDRKLRVAPGAISSESEGDLSDGFPPDKEVIGTVPLEGRAVDLMLERVAIAGGLQVWLFSPATVNLIPRLATDIESHWIEERLPASLVDTRFLDTALWQWLGLLLLTAVAFALSGIVAGLVLRALRPIARRTSSDLDDQLIAAIRQPVRFLLLVLVFRAGLGLIDPPLLLRGGIVRALIAASYIGFAWIALRLVDAAAAEFSRVMARRQRSSAISVVPLVRRTLKVIAVTAAIILTLNGWGYNTTALLAGLGVGGLAVALAAQKTIENLFGGVSIISDRPVMVGDFCRYGDKTGTVEDIGLRSTRIRTLDRTVVTVPNAQFSSMQLENFARRDKIWFHPLLRIRRDATPEQIRELLRTVKELLDRTPKIADARVRFIAISEHSLDLEVFAYVMTADFNEFLVIQEELLIRILELVREAGTALAVPALLHVSETPGVFSSGAPPRPAPGREPDRQA